MAIRWFYYAAPQNFYALAGRLWPWLAALATALGVAGLWVGFALAPEDAQQGEGYRSIFVHVPGSWMSSCEGSRVMKKGYPISPSL